MSHAAFYPLRTTHLLAALLAKENPMSVLKITHLVYHIDRDSLRRHNAPVTWDVYVPDLRLGPVPMQLSGLLSGMAGEQSRLLYQWFDLRGDSLGLKSGRTYPQLDQLSDADDLVIDSIWNRFGRMRLEDFVDHTRRFCPELAGGESERRQVREEDIFRAVGLSASAAAAAASELHAQRYIDFMFEKMEIAKWAPTCDKNDLPPQQTRASPGR